MSEEEIPEAEILVIPGVERRDIGGDCEDMNVLQGAIDAGVHDVIVVAKNRDGSFFLAASDGNTDAVVGKLFHATQWLAQACVVGRK